MMRFSEAAGLLFRGRTAPTARSDENAAVPLGPETAPDAPGPDVLAPDALGVDALDDQALLELLLGCVMRGRPVTDPAASAVAAFGSFAGVLAASTHELREVPGLGTHSIAAIRLVHDAALRLARAGLAKRRLLDEPQALASYLAMVLARERIEQFRILFLDADGALIADEAQARGTVNHTPVYPREVVRRAIELDSAALILVHNHPSGDPTPSTDDLEMTRQIEAASRVLEIEVRDHVIVGNGRVLSFRAQGLLGAR